MALARTLVRLSQLAGGTVPGRPLPRRGPLAGSLLSLLVPLALAAQAPSCPASDPPLWEVAGQEGSLHLLGSVHVLRPDAYPLDDSLMAILDEAAVVVFELDMTDLPRQAMLMIERGTFRDGRTLPEAIPEDAYRVVEARLQAIGVPGAMVQVMKPWLASLMLSSAVVQEGGYQPDWGLDMQLHRMAVARDKELRALETAEDQIAVFEGLTPEAQAAYLLATISELDDALARMDEMSLAWRAGDAEGLADLVREQLRDSPELAERILHRRNRRWIPTLVGLLEEGRPALVVVGTGHLVGEGSVVDLLEERGFPVERRGVGCFAVPSPGG